MKNSVHIFFFALMALVLGGALEEVLPRAFGVGFPILLALAETASPRRPMFAAVCFAVAAGAFEDALSGLPALTSVVCFVVAVLLVRWARFGRCVTAVTFPLCQMWVWLWVPDLGGSVFVRVLVAIPLGLVSSLAVDRVLCLVERRFALVG